MHKLHRVNFVTIFGSYVLFCFDVNLCFEIPKTVEKVQLKNN